MDERYDECKDTQAFQPENHLRNKQNQYESEDRNIVSLSKEDELNIEEQDVDLNFDEFM